jgi:hypothetical protein
MSLGVSRVHKFKGLAHGLERPEVTGMPLTREMLACAEHMRALGWYESHLFSYSFTRAPHVVGIHCDEWCLGRAIADRPGEYAANRRGATLAELLEAVVELGFDFTGDV